MSKKLCVCGRSARYPLCDASHETEGWSCLSGPQWARYGFCASPALINLALKLSAEFQGVLCDSPGVNYHVDTLVLLADSGDLDKLRLLNTHIQARQRLVIGAGHGTPFLQPLFPDATIYALDAARLPQAYLQVKAVLRGEVEACTVCQAPQSLFLSHAVADEPLIQPVVTYLKTQYAARIFTCQDSIPAAGAWHGEILAALLAAERVVVLLSQAMLASTFCAFEIGYALALDKRLSLIRLDAAQPPAYIQHLQLRDLPREQRIRPWLDAGDLLADALLADMQPEAPGL